MIIFSPNYLGISEYGTGLKIRCSNMNKTRYRTSHDHIRGQKRCRMTSEQLDREQLRLDRLVAELNIPQTPYIEVPAKVPLLKRPMPDYMAVLVWASPIFLIPVGHHLVNLI